MLGYITLHRSGKMVYAKTGDNEKGQSFAVHLFTFSWVSVD